MIYMSNATKPINGKRYPMWGGLVDVKAKFIGGQLTDIDADSTTIITDLSLESCGDDSAVFTMHGQDFNCAVNVAYGGISARPDGLPGFLVRGYQMSFLVGTNHSETALSA